MKNKYWLLDTMQEITDMIYGAPEPDSNEALRRWLQKNPNKEISDYPHA